MATSDAALANAALAHLGQAGTITTLSSDVTTAGKVLREFLPRARRETLQAYNWGCATLTAEMTLLETLTNGEYGYRYRLPENCLQPRRVVLAPYTRNPVQPIPYRTVADGESTDWSAATTYAVGDYARLTSTGVWYRATAASTNQTPPNGSYWTAITGGPPMWLECDFADASVEYTFDLTDPTRFTPDLESAVVALLAYYACTSITVNGSAQAIKNTVAGIWMQLTGQAMANDSRASQRDEPPPSRYVAARFRRGSGR